MLWKRLMQLWQSHRLYILLALAIAVFIVVSLLVPDPTGYGPQARPSATPSPTSQSGRLFQIGLSRPIAMEPSRRFRRADKFSPIAQIETTSCPSCRSS